MSTNTLSFDHCLRKIFTQRIFTELVEQGKSINLIGTSGQGIERLGEDVLELDQDTVLFLHTDLKAHRQSYANMLYHLSGQLNRKKPPKKLSNLIPN